VTKSRLLLLTLVLVFAVSGSSLPPASEAAPPHVAADSLGIAARLSQLNPQLMPAEAQRIEAAVLRYSEKYDLDPLLVTAVIEVESGARPWARSEKGALGLMQVMPYMIRPMDLAGNPSTIEANVEAGCMILSGNIQRLGEADGISAYFWGSRIRGVTYLNRVRAAQDRLREELRS
jgi:soluble lytic murein transglycosylase-like protein